MRGGIIMEFYFGSALWWLVPVAICVVAKLTKI
jgi:hypothetical protein